MHFVEPWSKLLEQDRKSSAAWDKEHGWGDVLGVALREAEAWTLFSEGERDDALAHLRSIAQYERDHPCVLRRHPASPNRERLLGKGFGLPGTGAAQASAATATGFRLLRGGHEDL
jgi:hypothetical protein